MTDDLASAGSLDEMRVLVFDCQSTGARPQHGALLELGWCELHGAASETPPVTSHLLQLPDGVRLPRQVSRITGITTQDLVDATSVELAYEALVACVSTVPVVAEGSTPTIIHYASYEKAWLRHLDETLAGSTRMSLDVVCTHEIAKRLLQLPRQGLRALAGYYGFRPDLVRRSAGHVAATAHVWRHLTRDLAAIDVTTWEGLRVWLKATPPLSRKSRTLPMSRAKRLALPDEPGVYRMLRNNGDVLYVGKATSLKKRVNSYFTKRRGHTERTMEMLTQARDIDVTVTTTAVEAALLETDLIKDHRPPYNVQLRDETRDAWFASSDLLDAAIAPDERFRIGPLPSKFALTSYAALRRLLVDQVVAEPRELARAMAMPLRFAPDAECFQAGVALLRDRYHMNALTHPVLMSLSKRLLGLARAGELDEGDRESDEHGWDPERVTRHLERVIMQAGQLMRRARWLCLMSESSVSWQLLGAPVRRLLVIESANVVQRALLPSDHAPPTPRGANLGRQRRQAAFDIAAYDRLRVLSTELKRITAEAREVDVRLNDRIVLRGRSLRQLLDGV